MAIMHVDGQNGSIEFDGRSLNIRRTGLVAGLMGADEVEIPIRSVTGVIWKEPGTVRRGHLGFTVPGTAEPGAALAPHSFSRNAVIFCREQRGDFEALKSAVEQAIEVTR